jgi:hypothetical protein
MDSRRHPERSDAVGARRGDRRGRDHRRHYRHQRDGGASRIRQCIRRAGLDRDGLEGL